MLVRLNPFDTTEASNNFGSMEGSSSSFRETSSESVRREARSKLSRGVVEAGTAAEPS